MSPPTNELCIYNTLGPGSPSGPCAPGSPGTPYNEVILINMRGVMPPKA